MPDLLKPDKSPETYPAVISVVELEKDALVYRHFVIFNGLLPGVQYAYRVGDKEGNLIL